MAVLFFVLIDNCATMLLNCDRSCLRAKQCSSEPNFMICVFTGWNN